MATTTTEELGLADLLRGGRTEDEIAAEWCERDAESVRIAMDVAERRAIMDAVFPVTTC